MKTTNSVRFDDIAVVLTEEVLQIIYLLGN